MTRRWLEFSGAGESKVTLPTASRADHCRPPFAGGNISVASISAIKCHRTHECTSSKNQFRRLSPGDQYPATGSHGHRRGGPGGIREETNGREVGQQDQDRV